MNYEGVYLTAGYPDPKKVQEHVSNIATKNCIPKHRAEILDFGCGTGLIGKYLKEDGGFENISGIDCSPKMLEQAELKKTYKNLVHLRLNQDDHVNSFPLNQRKKYDFVTAAGLINNNFMDLKIFEQMLMCLKPGGYLIFSARFSYMGQYWYTDVLEDLEKGGRVKFVEHEAFSKYDKLLTSVGKFTKTPSKVFVYQKLEEDSVLAANQTLKNLSSLSASTAGSDYGNMRKKSSMNL